MDARLTKAEQWELIVPHMKYMALLRNLRNLDEAKVGPKFKRQIGESLADPAEVAKSRQLPMRFLSAYRNVNDDVWAGYLSEALDHSVSNVPAVRGKTLVLIDASGSMEWSYSEKGTVSYYDSACLFGVAFAKTNDSDVYTYSNSVSPLFKLKPGEPVLSAMKRLRDRRYLFQGGTNTRMAVDTLWNKGYDRIVLLTDEQQSGGWGGGGDVFQSVPGNIPCYTFNIAGYTAGNQTDLNRVTVGGLTDAAFTMIQQIESTNEGHWPWEKK